MAAEEPARDAAAPDRRPLLAALLLVLAVLSSFGELEQGRRDENEIQIEWRQLLLERGTLSSHARVEAMAGSELQMVPVEGELRVLVVE